MGQLNLKHINAIAQGFATPAMVAETLQTLLQGINTIAQQTASSPQGLQGTPIPPSALTVTAADGYFDITITDNNPANQNLTPEYFLEYSTTVGFSQPSVIHLGPTRQYRIGLGNQTFYWRCYSQFGRASQPSSKTYFGTAQNPTPVVGGGSAAGPTPLPSTGSGTGTTNGYQGGVGYGILPIRNPLEIPGVG